EADEPDADGLAVDGPLQDHVGGEVGFLGARPVDVGGEVRKLGASHSILRVLKAKVELVVAESGGVVPHPVENVDDGVDVAGAGQAFVDQVGGEGRSLQEIPVVHQQGGGVSSPDLFDQRVNLGQADGLTGLVGVVVPAVGCGVEGGGGHDDQFSRLHPGREGYGEGQGQKRSHQPVPSSVQQRKTPSLGAQIPDPQILRVVAKAAARGVLG